MLYDVLTGVVRNWAVRFCSRTYESIFCKGAIVDNLVENLANYWRVLDGQEKSDLVRVQMLKEIFIF